MYRVSLLTVPTSPKVAACLHAGAYLTLLGTAFRLQGAGAALHTLGETEVAVVGAVVQVSQPRQGQDVVTGDPQDGQFGQLLPVGVAWHLGMAEHIRNSCSGPLLNMYPSVPTDVGRGVEAA